MRLPRGVNGAAEGYKVQKLPDSM